MRCMPVPTQRNEKREATSEQALTHARGRRTITHRLAFITRVEIEVNHRLIERKRKRTLSTHTLLYGFYL
jgi:hypothetical protein